MTCACTETSSARHRLVADDEARLDGERARDADALALAAGELVRIARRVLGAQPDLVEQLPHARVGRGALGELVDREPLAHDRADGHARIERRERILEDDLHLAAQLPQSRARRARATSMPSNSTRPDVGSMRRRITRPVVDLPHPDSPTRPSVSPGIDVERDAVHGAHRAGRAAEHAALDREVLGEVADGEQRLARRRRRAASRHARVVAPRCAASGAMRMLRDARAPRRGGSATCGRRRSDRAADARVAQRSHAYGHRSWKRQPVGHVVGGGTVPGIVASRSRSCADARHRAEQPFGVRMMRAREQLGRRRFLDDLAARTSRSRASSSRRRRRGRA